jgi:hypothetical protein
MSDSRRECTVFIRYLTYSMQNWMRWVYALAIVPVMARLAQPSSQVIPKGNPEGTPSRAGYYLYISHSRHNAIVIAEERHTLSQKIAVFREYELWSNCAAISCRTAVALGLLHSTLSRNNFHTAK